MKEQSKLEQGIKWTARILGSLVLIFLLIFVFAHLFGEEDNLSGFSSTSEALTFICFPICTILGLLIAFKWEGIGGGIVLLGVLGLLLLRSDVLLSPLMLSLFLPGALYFIYWLVYKKLRKES